MSGQEPRTFRSMFISDVHLGSKAAKAEFLIDFLRYHDAD
ncbi:UDP-2,3-diacylglucosamine diphosphatase, partial [Mesorhizobium sp. M7A.F.Ca.CA.002.04.1.1]